MLNLTKQTLVANTEIDVTMPKPAYVVLVKNFSDGDLSVSVNDEPLDDAVEVITIKKGTLQKVLINASCDYLIRKLTLQSTGAGDVELQGILF